MLTSGLLDLHIGREHSFTTTTKDSLTIPLSPHSLFLFSVLRILVFWIVHITDTKSLVLHNQKIKIV